MSIYLCPECGTLTREPSPYYECQECFDVFWSWKDKEREPDL